MRRTMFNLFLMCVVLMYLATNNGQMKIKSFVQGKFNYMISQTIGNQVNSINGIFDDILR